MKRAILSTGVVCLLFSCTPAPEPEAVPEPKADAQADQTLQVMDKWWNDVWMQGKLELVPELVGPTYVRHRPERTWSVTPEEHAKVIAARREQYPDLNFIVHDYSVDGNRYWARWSVTATDSETGEAFLRCGVQIYRLENGKLVETWIASNPPGTQWLELSASDTSPETE